MLLFASVAGVGVLGCQDPETATLFAVPGCGLEGQVSEIQVQTRGDFPPSLATSVIVENGNALVGSDLGRVMGITVEGGKFGAPVSAVGRTSRLRPDGEVPIYFAAVDQVCEVDEGVLLFRDPGAMAVSEAGDVLIVGGRDHLGGLVDEIVHMVDEVGDPDVIRPRLPSPATGQSVHAVGPRSFVVVGGAGQGPDALAELVRLDVISDGDFVLHDPVPIEVPLQPESGRAHHGAAVLRDGRIYVTGGCAQVLDGTCVATAESVLATAFIVDAREKPAQFQRGPPLLSPRYGHQLLIARDGVAFAVGGHVAGGEASLQIDRLLPGSAFWDEYGPALTSELADTAAIEGSALLDGGLIILAMDDGTMRWVSEEATGVLPGWCDPGEPTGACFVGQRETVMAGPPRRDGTGGGIVDVRSPGRRPLLALWGERILADHYLLPVAVPGATGASARDASGTQPQQRTGALSVQLADGSVLLAGGFEANTQEPVRPVFLRLRPALDGPDESIPDVGALVAGAFIGLQPDRVEFDNGELRLSSAGVEVAFPPVRAHVRGFRSRNFRFEATLTRLQQGFPHVVLEQGAIAGLSVRFGPDVVRGYSRDEAGRVLEFTCGTLSESFWETPQTLEVTVRPDSLVVSAGGAIVAQCPVPEQDLPVAVGLGVSGSGSVLATQLRLTRI